MSINNKVNKWNAYSNTALKNNKTALTGVAQWVGHSPQTKGCQFDSRSGHMPGLRARSLVG